MTQSKSEELLKMIAFSKEQAATITDLRQDILKLRDSNNYLLKENGELRSELYKINKGGSTC